MAGLQIIPTILLVVFVTLKLCGVIAWPWLWVLAPFWMPLSLAIVLYAVAGFFVGQAFKR